MNSDAFAPLHAGVFEHTERLGGPTAGWVFAFLVLLQNRKTPPIGVSVVSGRQVARFLGLALSTVQRALTRLEKGRYITRYPTGGWRIAKARLGRGRRVVGDRDSRSLSSDNVTSNRDHDDLESRSHEPETVTSNRDQADSESRSPVTSNRDHPRSRSAITVTSNRGHETPQLPIPSTTSSQGEGRGSEDVGDGRRLQDPSAAIALAKSSPNPFRFVAYWQDATTERDFAVRVEPVEGLEELVVEKASELGLRVPRSELARIVQRTRERFVAEYSRRDRCGKTRGHRVGPQRLTEEFVGWLRKDLAGAASRASPRASPATKEQHRNADDDRRKQKIREAQERERHGTGEHDTQGRRPLAR